MLYMSGSGVQIFSLGIVFMLLISPFSAVFGILRGELVQAVNQRSFQTHCVSEWHDR